MYAIRSYYEILQVNGYEADDIIGTLTEKHTGNGLDIVVVSNDRDLWQLVDDDRLGAREDIRSSGPPGKNSPGDTPEEEEGTGKGDQERDDAAYVVITSYSIHYTKLYDK